MEEKKDSIYVHPQEIFAASWSGSEGLRIRKGNLRRAIYPEYPYRSYQNHKQKELTSEP